MEQTLEPKTQEPVAVDVAGRVPLQKELEGMNKRQLIQYANEQMGYTIDEKLTKEAIVTALVQLDDNRKMEAQKVNRESTAKAVSETDPAIKVQFYNMESPTADLEFAYPGPRGMRGPVNKKGFSKCPVYHLFPGQITELPYSVIEHLEGLTFTTHQPHFDPMTGMQDGAIPVIKPRFILKIILTKEQMLKAQAVK